MEHPVFEIVTTTMGVVSIRNKIVNEIMHNPVGPWAEANALYIEQSDLKFRLQENLDDELVIFDVGLGAAANALAALACIDGVENTKPVRLVSFERDMELLAFALKHSDNFEHFRGYEEALRSILERGFWKNERVQWHLRRGDFLTEIDAEVFRPHLIFFDPYSPKVNEDMWTTACFKKIRKHCREKAEGGTSLFTYSRATRIRAALIAAGFCVGYGKATGLKDETTQAATTYDLLRSPLGEEWYTRWQRSHLRDPFDADDDNRADVERRIRDYFDQFQKPS